MKKIGIAMIAIILCASLLIACTPGYTMDRVFSFFGGFATDGNAASYATDGNVIFVSAGNIVSFGNAFIATSGDAFATSGNAFATNGNAFTTNGNAVASAGNAAVATAGNSALPAFTVDQSAPSGKLRAPTPTPAG